MSFPPSLYLQRTPKLARVLYTSHFGTCGKTTQTRISPTHLVFSDIAKGTGAIAINGAQIRMHRRLLHSLALHSKPSSKRDASSLFITRSVHMSGKQAITSWHLYGGRHYLEVGKPVNLEVGTTAHTALLLIYFSVYNVFSVFVRPKQSCGEIKLLRVYIREL